MAKPDRNEVKRYRVGHIPQNAKRERIVTEIRRPEPQAVLILREGDVVELTNGEMFTLLNQDGGPLVPFDLLTLVEDAPKATAKAPAAEPSSTPGETKAKAAAK